MLRMENITNQGVRILYSETMDGLKMEKNKWITDLAEILMLIIIAISLLIHILSLKSSLI